KNGYVYALDASSGGLIWWFNPPSIKRVSTENANYVSTGKYDPLQPWINYPSNKTFLQCPGLNGGIESDAAYAYDKIYVASYNFCITGQVQSVDNSSNNNTGITNVQ